MKKQKLIWGLLIVSFVLAVKPVGAAVDSKGGFQTRVLANGITLKYKVMSDQPLVSMYAVFPIGAAAEREKGTAHLLEHMIFRGGSGYDFNDIMQVTTRRGGWFNGFTTTDMTSYNYVVPKENLEEALKIFNGCLWHPDLDKDILEKEKAIIVNELDISYASRYRLYPIVKYYYSEMFHSKETLSSISSEDLKEFFTAHYQPQNVTYIIAGDFNVDAVSKQLERIINGYEFRQTVKPAKMPIALPKGKLVEERNLYPYKFQVMLGYTFDDLNPKERLLLHVLNFMYGTDYKVDYLHNRFKISNVLTRNRAGHDYFVLYYVENRYEYSDERAASEKKALKRYFEEFEEIDLDKELENFRRMIEQEEIQRNQSSTEAVEYELERLFYDDAITVDSLRDLDYLKKSDLEGLLQRFKNREPDLEITVKTTK